MTDARLSKQTVNRRASRAAQNRAVTEARESTDADRLSLFRQAHAQSALPNLPPIPGYHVCWLASNNSKDTLSWRRRLGYEPIKPEEIVGFGEFAVGQGGTVDGLVHVNEMVAFKLPIDIYHEYMVENHHNAPLREEGKLTDTARQTKEQANRSGSRVELGDGVDALESLDSIRTPDFTNDN
jgi:hypothetical protein